MGNICKVHIMFIKWMGNNFNSDDVYCCLMDPDHWALADCELVATQSHYFDYSTQWTRTTFCTIRTTCYIVPLLGLLSEPTLLALFALLAQSTPLTLLTLVTLVRLVAQITVVTSNWGTWHCQGQKALSRTLITLGPCQTECRIACHRSLVRKPCSLNYYWLLLLLVPKSNHPTPL